MVVVDGQGLPLGNHLHSASPAEVKLAETTLATIRVGRSHHAGRPRQKPMRVIADRAYDSDPLRKQLAARGIELIVPHEESRTPGNPGWTSACDVTSGDGSWNAPSPGSETSADLVVRYDRSLTIYCAFFHIACFMIVLRRVLK